MSASKIKKTIIVAASLIGGALLFAATNQLIHPGGGTGAVPQICPLSISCPSNITVYSCTNVPVFYYPTATNPCCGNVNVTTYPLSGTYFAPDTTNVINATDVDCFSNMTSCTFTVIVLTNNCFTSSNCLAVTCPTNKQVPCGTSWTFDQPSALSCCTQIFNGSNTNLQVVSTGIFTNGTCPLVEVTATWQITDACGETTNCSQTVTIAGCCTNSGSESNCCADCLPPYPDSYTVTLFPGTNYLADSLCQGTNATLDQILTNVPNRTVFYTWDPVAQQVGPISAFMAGSWTTNETLSAGEGFVLKNPLTVPFTITISGCAPNCPLPCTPSNGYTLVGGLGTNTSTWTNLFSCPPPCGTEILFWDGSGFTTNTYFNGTWVPPLPVPLLSAGESVFVVVTTNVGQDSNLVTISVQGASPTGSSNSYVACSGQSVTFTATVAGGGPLTYQWEDDQVAIVGAVNPTFTIPSMTLVDAGTYCVVVSGSCGSVEQCVTLQSCATNCITLNCPSNIVVATCSNCAQAFYSATATNACCASNVALSYSLPSGTCFNLGITTVQVTAYDPNCVSTPPATCSFTVTVLQSNNCPTNCLQVQCPNNFSVPCGSNWSFGEPTATTCCTNYFTFNGVLTNISIVPQGIVTNGVCPQVEITETWAISDGCDHLTNCSQTVTVTGCCTNENCCSNCTAPYPDSYSVTVYLGSNYVADTLCQGANDTLGDVMPNANGQFNGLDVYFWNPATQSYSTADFGDSSIGGNGWVSGGGETFIQGSGVMIINTQTNPITITFAGCQPSCPPPCVPSNGVSLVSAPGTNGAIAWSNLFSCPPPCGTELSIWNAASQQFAIYTYNGGVWTPPLPVPLLAPGQAAWVDVSASSPGIVLTCPGNYAVPCSAAWSFGEPSATSCCTNYFTSSTGVLTNISVTPVSIVTNGACPKVEVTETWQISDACGDVTNCSQTITITGCCTNNTNSTPCCSNCFPPYPESYTVTIVRGFNFLADDLCQGGNTLNDMMPNVPSSVETLYFWTGVGYGGDYTYYDANDSPNGIPGWFDPFGNPAPASSDLSPGEGFILDNQSTNFTLTIYGCPPGCPLPCQPTATNELYGGYGTNAVLGWTNLFSCPPPCGTRMELWNSSASSFNIYNYVNGIWNPPLPVPLLQVGQSAFVQALSNSSCCPTVTNLTLNTGLNPNSNNLYGFSQADAVWWVTKDPTANTTLPRPATVISPNPYWKPAQPDSEWISSYPTEVDNTNGEYDFQTYFCTSSDATNLALSICLRADDAAACALNGHLITLSPTNTAFNAAVPACGVAVSPSWFIYGGQNVLTVYVTNIYAVAMGLNADVSVTGEGLIPLGAPCCQFGSGISGQKFYDLNCNGVQDPNEPGLSGWEIQLSNGSNTYTDVNGYYYFTNLPPGTYTVTEVQQGGWSQSAPAGGSYTITLTNLQQINELNFGNCYTNSSNNCVHISCPGDITVLCSNNGAIVNYIVTATNTCGTNAVHLYCNPPPTHVFPVGTTTVNCTAWIDSGPSATCSFTVTVLSCNCLQVECPVNYSVACGSNWSFGEPAATSCCPSNISGTLTNVSIVSTGIVTNGVCPLVDVTETWQITDACGDVTNCSQTVSITGCCTNPCNCTNGVSGPLAGENLTILHSFTDGSDGAYPIDSLLLSGNTLYGTAYGGGNGKDGTVFAVQTDGSGFMTLHSFAGAPSDGSGPSAGLILSGNTLYGATQVGGSFGYGTVFALNSGTQVLTTLHSFNTSSDGSWPSSTLVLSGNTLYGTAEGGGSTSDGTIFSIHTDGTGFTILRTLNNNTDGNEPHGLVISGNTLYGAAAYGPGSGMGALYSIQTSGAGYTVLHDFSASDGEVPFSSLVLSGNTLYGTAQTGGSASDGTIFAYDINTLAFSVLHNFNGSGGSWPYAGLMLSGSTLFGTTEQGGAGYGNGTVFALQTDGSAFTVLHSFFGAPADGAGANAGLVLSGNTLFGTTEGGGASNYGTVFALTLTNLGTNCLQVECPSNIVTTSCTNVQEIYAPTVTDLACTNWTVVCTPPSGSYFPFGTTTVTCSVTDCCGNSNSCSFTVTVNPGSGFQAQCPNSFTVPCGSNWSFGEPTATTCCTNYVAANGVLTNISIVPISIVTNGVCPQVEVTEAWQISDGCGDVTNCSQTVTVIGCCTNPCLQVQCPNSFTVPCVSNWSFGEPTATSCCSSNISGTLTNVSIVSTGIVTNGLCPQVDVTETWQISDACGDVTNCSQTVTITGCCNGTNPCCGPGLGAQTIQWMQFPPTNAPILNPDPTGSNAIGTWIITNLPCYGEVLVTQNFPDLLYWFLNPNFANVKNANGEFDFTETGYGPYSWSTTSSLLTLYASNQDNYYIDFYFLNGAPNPCTLCLGVAGLAEDTTAGLSQPFTFRTEYDITNGNVETPSAYTSLNNTWGNNLIPGVSGTDVGSAYLLSGNYGDVYNTGWAVFQPAATLLTTNIPPGSIQGYSGPHTNIPFIRLYVQQDAGDGIGFTVGNICPCTNIPPCLQVDCPGDFAVSCASNWSFGQPTATTCCTNYVAANGVLTNVSIVPVSIVTNGVCPQVEVTETWQISDGCGDVTNCSQTVTVIGCCSNACLQVQCPENYSVPCQSNWFFGEPTATSCCTNYVASTGVLTNVSITSQGFVTNGTCPQVEITENWIISDGCGDVTNCSQTVTVIGCCTNPCLQVQCPISFTVPCDTAWSFGLPMATSCCTNEIVSLNGVATNVIITSTGIVTNGVCPNVTVTETWMIADACGDSTNCSQTVTITGCCNSTNPCCGPGLGAQTIQWLQFPPTNAPDLIPDPSGSNAVGTWTTNNLPCYGEVLVTQTFPDLLYWSLNPNLASVKNANGEFDFTETGYGPYSWSTTAPILTLYASNQDSYYIDFYFLNGAPNPCTLCLGVAGLAEYTTAGLSQPFTFRTEYDITNASVETPSAYTSLNSNWGNALIPGVTGTLVGSAYTLSSNHGDIYNTGWSVFQPAANLLTTNIPPGSIQGYSGPYTNIPFIRLYVQQDSGDGIGFTIGNICPCSCLQVECPTNKTVQCGSGWNFDLPQATTCCTNEIAGSNGVATNISIISVSTVTNGSCPQVITQTWYISDACGNNTNCSQIVTVENTNPPAVTCASNITVPSGEAWSFTPPAVVSNACCTTVSVNVVSTTTNISTQPCEIIYTRIWEILGCCSNVSYCTQIVTVIPTSPCQVFNTGMSETNALAGDAVDPNFALISQPVGGHAALPDAVVIYPADANALYGLRDGPNSQWIGPDPTVSGSEPGGVYHYQLQFLLCCTNGAQLCGQMAADNSFTAYLNNTQYVGGIGGNYGFANWTPMCVYSGFVVGLNTLDIYVTNEVGGKSSTAFRAELTNCINPLTVYCPTDKTVPCDTNWSFNPPTAYSCCSSNVTIEPLNTTTNGTCPMIVTRTWLVMDGCSNGAICDQTVTVVPVPVTLICSSNLTVNAGQAWSFTPPLASNACCTNLSICVLTIVTNVTCDPCAINYTCTWQVTDCCTNTSTCSQTVTVLPASPCQIFNTGMSISTPQPGGTTDPNFNLVSYPDGALVIYPGDLPGGYLPDGPDSQWIGPDAYSYYEPYGVYHYQLKFVLCCTNGAELNGRMAADNTAGVYLNNQYITAVTESSSSGSWTPIAVSNHFVTCPALNVLDIYVTNFYDLEDPYPSSPTAFRAELTNCVSPLVVFCPTDKTVECNSNWTFDLPKASSCCGGKITIRTTSTVTNGVCPKYVTNVWLISDACGDSQTCTQVVTVIDTIPPVITCPTYTYIVPLNSNCQLVIPPITVTATDACTPQCDLVFSQNPPVNTIINGTSALVTNTVTDLCGNTASCVAHVVGINKQGMVVTWPSNLVVTNCLVPCAAPYITVTDCSCPTQVPRITQSPLCGAMIGPGIMSVTVTVTDCNNATATKVIPLVIESTEESFLSALTNTGLSPTGALLPNGAVDPHYTLGPVPNATPGYTAPQSLAVTTVWGAMEVIRYSGWIAPCTTGHNSLYNCPIGDYTYTNQFNLPAGANPATASITGRWAAQGGAVQIYLNGHPTLNSITPPNGYNHWTPFVINTGFASGNNTLLFVVTNSVKGPTGLRVEITNASVCTTCVPPAIVSISGSQSLTEGSTANFTVHATGTPTLAYQWEFNNVPIGGATASTLQLRNVTYGRAGLYTVIITDPCGETNGQLSLTVTRPLPWINASWDVSDLTDPLGATYGPDLTLAGSGVNTNFALSVGTTEDFGLPNPGGQIVNAMDINPLDGAIIELPPVVLPGAAYDPSYTLLMDIYEPDTSLGTPSTLYSSYDCCVSNLGSGGQDGVGLTLDASNNLHITGSIGGTLFDSGASARPLAVDDWNRVVLVVDSPQDGTVGSATAYVNGQTAIAIQPCTCCILSQTTSGTGMAVAWTNGAPTILSASTNTGAVNAEFYVSSVQFHATAFTPQMVAGAGSPSTGTAPVNQTTIESQPVLTASLASGAVNLTWAGSPYELQETTDLNSGEWVTSQVAFTESTDANGDVLTTAVAQPSADAPAKFYRLVFRP